MKCNKNKAEFCIMVTTQLYSLTLSKKLWLCMAVQHFSSQCQSFQVLNLWKTPGSAQVKRWLQWTTWSTLV